MDKKTEIRGIQVDIIEKILMMIQEKFPAFNDGTYYMAAKFNLDNDIGYHNLRDMLTHFEAAILKTKTHEERNTQIILAEEHLRRALVEPYELVANMKLDDARQLFKEFIERQLSASKKDKVLLIEVEELKIEEKFKEIGALLVSAREKKAVNLWNDEWERSVEEFTFAADKGLDLCDILRIRIQDLKRKSLDRRSRNRFIWAFVTTVLLGIFGIAITILGILLSRA